jgi:hypothetical protein
MYRVLPDTTYTLIGIYLNPGFQLLEASISTQDPAQLFWGVYNQLVLTIRRDYGDGTNAPIGVFLQATEEDIVQFRHHDPDWSGPLWPTEFSVPICQPWNQVLPDTPFYREQGGSLMKCAPYRWKAHQGTHDLEQVVWRLWFTNSTYAIINPLPPLSSVDPLLIPVIMTAGDMESTFCMPAYEVDSEWNYQQFMSSLIIRVRDVSNKWANILFPIYSQGSFMYEDFAIYLLPPNIPMSDSFYRLLVLLSFATGKSNYLLSVLFRLPWEGPLAQMTWTQVTGLMHEGDFKILIVTGRSRMHIWLSAPSHGQFVKNIVAPTDVKDFYRSCVSLLDMLITRGKPRWAPKSTFTPKAYSIPTLTHDQLQTLDSIRENIDGAILNRSTVISLRKDIRIQALIEHDTGGYRRLTVHTSPRNPRGAFLAAAHTSILTALPGLLDTVHSIGILVTPQDYVGLVVGYNQRTPPAPPAWLKDKYHRFYEVHRILDLANDNILCRPYTNYLNDTRLLCVLFARVDPTFPKLSQLPGRDREIIVHVVDGTFTHEPIITLEVRGDWDYNTFLTHLLVTLKAGNPRFGALYRSLTSLGVFHSGDVRIFLVPDDFSVLQQVICALICDNLSRFNNMIGRVLGELTWDGCARSFTIDDVLPPDGTCHFLVFIREDYRREWSPVPDGEFSYFLNAIYRAARIWYVNVVHEHPRWFNHVHWMLYYNDSRHERVRDPEILQVQHVEQAMSYILRGTVNPQVRESISRMKDRWGNYI